MKKLATTIGLFTLMLVVTSFTTPNETGGKTMGGEPTLFTGDTGGKTMGGEPTLFTGETGGKTMGGEPTI